MNAIRSKGTKNGVFSDENTPFFIMKDNQKCGHLNIHTLLVIHGKAFSFDITHGDIVFLNLNMFELFDGPIRFFDRKSISSPRDNP
jgi:hypothetical protein